MISPRNKFVNVSLSDFPGTRVTEKLAKENLDRKNALAGFFTKNLPVLYYCRNLHSFSASSHSQAKEFWRHFDFLTNL
jgi:hypothetical protein